MCSFFLSFFLLRPSLEDHIFTLYHHLSFFFLFFLSFFLCISIARGVEAFFLFLSSSLSSASLQAFTPGGEKRLGFRHLERTRASVTGHGKRETGNGKRETRKDGNFVSLKQHIWNREGSIFFFFGLTGRAKGDRGSNRTDRCQREWPPPRFA